MDELEKLKEDWKRNEDAYPKLSYQEIYKMLAKKSSSIVKWIFIISILEFVLWTGLSLFLKDAEFNQRFKEYGAQNIMVPLMIVGYIILFYFFYKFFMNYKRISVIENSMNLMEQILKTRKTVRHYIAFNLIYLVVVFFVTLSIRFNKDELVLERIEMASANGELFLFYAKTIGLSLVFLAIVILLILGFYYLIYGLLMRRLNLNYKELKKMEI